MEEQLLMMKQTVPNEKTSSTLSTSSSISSNNNTNFLMTPLIFTSVLCSILLCQVDSFTTQQVILNRGLLHPLPKHNYHYNTFSSSASENKFHFRLYNDNGHGNIDGNDNNGNNSASLLEIGRNQTDVASSESTSASASNHIVSDEQIGVQEELGNEQPDPTAIIHNNDQNMSATYIEGYFPIETEDDDDKKTKKLSRFLAALPSITMNKKKQKMKIGDKMDKDIIKTSVPSMLNMAVVPIVNSVDTFWVGRLGIALALAGQAAANQAFFSLYFLVSFLPTITAPLVATAVGSGDDEQAQTRVCEALFLSNILGALGTIMLVGFPETSLGLVLSKDAAAMEYAVPYLRFRALSMIPALISATGFSAYRGLLNTVTPLKVSLVTNVANLIADPIMISGFGVGGAAMATAGAEGLSGLIYLRLLMRRKLVQFKRLFQVPSWSSLKPLIQAGSAMLLFQLVLNVAFLTAARRVQAMDPTGISAAAYGIVMQIYSVGVVCHVGMKASAATLVPSIRATKGDAAARNMADKLFIWGTIVGIMLGTAQMAITPFITPLFTTIPEVREAIRVPALITALIQFANGPLFVGEGVMVGMGKFKALTSCTLIGCSVMIASILSPLGNTLNGVLVSLAMFNCIQSVAMVWHHLKIGPFSKRGLRLLKKKEKEMELKMA